MNNKNYCFLGARNAYHFVWIPVWMKRSPWIIIKRQKSQVFLVWSAFTVKHKCKITEPLPKSRPRR